MCSLIFSLSLLRNKRIHQSCFDNSCIYHILVKYVNLLRISQNSLQRWICFLVFMSSSNEFPAGLERVQAQTYSWLKKAQSFLYIFWVKFKTAHFLSVACRATHLIFVLTSDHLHVKINHEDYLLIIYIAK